MFTYIKLKNFMSFKDVTFDLKKGSKGAKNFIAVYGENGSGKSNFVSSIDLLRRSIDSFEEFVNKQKIAELAQERDWIKGLVETILGSNNILNLINSCRMAECDKETTLEYGFQTGGDEGNYFISFSEKFSY